MNCVRDQVMNLKDIITSLGGVGDLHISIKSVGFKDKKETIKKKQNPENKMKKMHFLQMKKI